MDRAQLADFLRTRREALQPEDVGLPRGPRRRTGGLRREEVAALSGMSADYYGRIEQQRGPRPSEQMVAALARGLRLTLEERDHLFRLAGHATPGRAVRAEHVAPGMMRILDRLEDTAAQVMTTLGETLVQTRPAKALLGDETRFTGPERAVAYRWFTRPESRAVYPREDHAHHARMFTAQLRETYTHEGPGSRAAELVELLKAQSPQFAGLWAAHDVGKTRETRKRISHPEAGILELYCQTLLDPDHGQILLVLTAKPGTESHERLELLTVLGEARTDV
ncbi:helix-turn-helix transcriptional regulator [Dactylosporangium sp. CA-233914]|uniref:helix-turn-helix transcriptional regulator n=1 Tax=Dactylosporangium sp. CA-233914 TaxID=3239934 RepID=UPI003D8C88DC